MLTRATAFAVDTCRRASWSGAGEPAVSLDADGISLAMPGSEGEHAASSNAPEHIGLDPGARRVAWPRVRAPPILTIAEPDGRVLRLPRPWDSRAHGNVPPPLGRGRHEGPARLLGRRDRAALSATALTMATAPPYVCGADPSVLHLPRAMTSARDPRGRLRQHEKADTTPRRDFFAS
jgi:hypothetical protein